VTAISNIRSASCVDGRRSRRVCHVAYTFYENDNRVIRYAEALQELGDEVEVIALRRAAQSRVETWRGVRVFRVQSRAVNERKALTYFFKILVFFVRAATLLTWRHLWKRYDIVHVHNVPDFLVFTAWLPKLTGARIVLDIHDILPELYAGKFAASLESSTFRALLKVERASCGFADHVIVANHLWHDRLVSRCVPASKCTTMLNYPDLRLFAPAAIPRNDGRFIILYPGTLNQHQGLDIAVRAFELVKDSMPGSEFHIYGEGPARGQIEALIGNHGLEGRVKLMPLLPIREIASIMAAADVGIVPKRADGFGNEAFSTKILEFMACGVPVVISRTAVDAHYFDERLVKFFAPHDERDLGSALLWAYKSAPDRSARAKAGREFAVRNSWQERVVDYRGLIEALVGRSSAVVSV